MKYHDTGSRVGSEALSNWLKAVLNEEVSEFRVQTGYFSAKALGVLLPMLEKAAQSNSTTKFLIGSNGASTLKSHVEKLFELMKIPRSNAYLGVVSFGTGLFHSKSYHVRRTDGSQAAFVGSANLTREGLALNVEAAISLDTRDGDDGDEISKIAAAIDGWFVSPMRQGFTLLDHVDVINDLAEKGILAKKSPPRPAGTKTDPSATLPKLKRLTDLPSVPIPAAITADSEDDFDRSPAPNVVKVSTVTSVRSSANASASTSPQVSAIKDYADKNAFWIETGALTGGSSNQLDLSMVTKHGNIPGSVSLFGVNSGATDVLTSICIRYLGVDYVNNQIKFPVTAEGQSNGTWRLQLNGTDSRGQKLTALCANFVQQILLFVPIAPNHYEISMVRPRAELTFFKEASNPWDRNRGAGRHFGRISRNVVIS